MAEILLILQIIYPKLLSNILIWPSVSIGLGNDLASKGDKALLNPMMINIHNSDRLKSLYGSPFVNKDGKIQGMLIPIDPKLM